MFREAGGALSRQPSQDNGLDGPFGSGASKLEQVPKTQMIPNVPQRDLINLTNILINDEKGF